MSPAHGRPPSEEPRNIALNIRLSQKDDAVLMKCCQKFGLTKTEMLLTGLDVMELACNNSEFRQLIDAVRIYKQIAERQDRLNFDEYSQMMKRQINQIKFNFEEFLKTLK